MALDCTLWYKGQGGESRRRWFHSNGVHLKSLQTPQWLLVIVQKAAIRYLKSHLLRFDPFPKLFAPRTDFGILGEGVEPSPGGVPRLI